MRQHIQERLAGLRNEYEKGQGQLRQLESQSNALRETLIRISGAIMVLEELVSPSPVAPANGNQAELIKVDADQATAQK
jgi:hypothetical protein